MNIAFPFGKGSLNAEIPEKNILRVVSPNEMWLSPQSSFKLLKKAFSSPMETEKLSDIVRGSKLVAVVVDDYTRPCPTAQILPHVLEEIKNGGGTEENTRIIFACGTHEKVTDEDAEKLLGTKKLKFASSSTKDSPVSEYEHVGTTSRKTPVKLNKAFLEADVRVLVSDVELHYFAGYGGGRKSILPGISSYETIQNNHKLMFNDNCRLGNLDGNPVHLDMMESYELARADFLVNVVQNTHHEIVSAFAGSHKGFSESVKIVDKLYKTKIPEKADIAIASADGYPHDIDLYQSMKAIQTVIDVLKENGVLILVGECSKGHGSQKFYEDMKEYSTSDDVKQALLKDFIMGRHKVYYLLKALEKVNIISVSRMDQEMVEKVFRMKYATDIDSALKHAFEIAGRDANILISQHATTTLVQQE